MTRTRPPLDVVAAAAFLVGCAQTPNGESAINREQIATGVGAVAGGVAGAFLGGNKETSAALAGLGAVVGAGVGNQIGTWLDERQQAELDRAVAEALANDRRQKTWTSSDGAARGDIRITPAGERSTNVRVRKRPEVTTPPSMDLIGGNRVVADGARLRAGPGRDHAVVDGVGGRTLETVGRARGTDWVLVADDGRSLGWVHDSLLTEPREAAPRRPEMSAVTTADSGDTGDDTTVADVELTSECRNLEVDIETAEGGGDESFRSCRATDGAWELL